MCDPLTIAAGVLSASSQLVAYEGQVAATDAQNQVNARAHQNASLAAQYQYEEAQRKFIYESRENQQKGFEAAMQGREALSTGAAQAGASGLDMASISIGDLLNEQRRQTAQNLQNINTRQEDLTQAFTGDVKGAQMQAQSRIDATPFQSGPSKLGLMIGLAKTGVDTYKAATKD